MGNQRKTGNIPAVSEGKRGVDGHIGYLLRQAGNVHRLRMERALAEHAVTLPQFLVLTMLGAYPGLSNADLARLSMLTPQTLSVIVKNLDRGGAIERRRHAHHGRIRQIELTEKGRELLAACRKSAHQVENAMLTGLSSEEEATVRRWLVSVALLATETE